MALLPLLRPSLVDIPDALHAVLGFLPAGQVARFASVSTAACQAAKTALRDLDWLVFALGGGLPTVEAYSVREERWRTAATLPLPLNAQVVEFEGFIYAFGSSEFRKEQQRVSRYSPSEDRWEDLGELPSAMTDTWGCQQMQPRQVTTCAGSIYIAGQRHIGRFDPPNRWQLLPAMPGDALEVDGLFTLHSGPASRQGFKLVAVGRRLYAVGGESQTRRGWRFSNKVDCYDPRTHEWTSCADLPTGASCSAACLGSVVGLGSRILVVEDGNDSNDNLSSGCTSRVWALDTACADSWSELPSGKISRRHAFSVVVKDSLYMMGGFARNYTDVAQVERVSINKDGSAASERFAEMKGCGGSGTAIAVPELDTIFAASDRIPAEDDDTRFRSPFESLEMSIWKPSTVTSAGWEDGCSWGEGVFGGEWRTLPCVPTPRLSGRLAVVRVLREHRLRRK